MLDRGYQHQKVAAPHLHIDIQQTALSRTPVGQSAGGGSGLGTTCYSFLAFVFTYRGHHRKSLLIDTSSSACYVCRCGPVLLTYALHTTSAGPQPCIVFEKVLFDGEAAGHTVATSCWRCSIVENHQRAGAASGTDTCCQKSNAAGC